MRIKPSLDTRHPAARPLIAPPRFALGAAQAGCVALGAALAGSVALCAAQPAPEVFCGSGPGPGSPGFDAHGARRQAQQASLGYVLVCDSDLERIDQSRRLELMGHARHRLVFEPLDLSRTVFARFTTLGEVPSHSINAQAFALRRHFRDGDDRFVSTLEWQMRAAGGSVTFHGNPVTVSVLGHDAVVTRLQSPTGQAYAALAWTVDGVFLQVSVRAPTASGVTQAFVVGLAEALTTARLAASR